MAKVFGDGSAYKRRCNCARARSSGTRRADRLALGQGVLTRVVPRPRSRRGGTHPFDGRRNQAPPAAGSPACPRIDASDTGGPCGGQHAEASSRYRTVPRTHSGRHAPCQRLKHLGVGAAGHGGAALAPGVLSLTGPRYQSSPPPTTRLSVTALAWWCRSGNWLDGLAADEVAPMLFRMGKDAELLRQMWSATPEKLHPRCRSGAIGRALQEPLAANTLSRYVRIYSFDAKHWRN